ncbi:MAG: hypothetical protein IKS43_01270 [Clostridia bacterium]|nr:hypothetical protein [Clostridia bacterium]
MNERELYDKINSLSASFEEIDEHRKAAACQHLLFEYGKMNDWTFANLSSNLWDSVSYLIRSSIHEESVEEAEEALKWASEGSEALKQKAKMNLGYQLVQAGMKNAEKRSGLYRRAEGLLAEIADANVMSKATYVIAMDDRFDSLDSTEQQRLCELTSDCVNGHLDELQLLWMDLPISYIMMKLCVMGIGRTKDDDVGYEWAKECDKRSGTTNYAEQYFKKKVFGGYKCVYSPWIKRK